MAQFNQNDFETTLLNRAELEQALGLKIDLKKDDSLNLEYYAMFEYIPLDEVICIFLELDHNKRTYKKNDNFHTIYRAIETQVRNGTLPAKVEQDHDINGHEIQYDISLSHKVAEQWAKTHNLLWNVPPYKAVNINTQTADNSELVQQLTAKDEEIARLKAEIESLKQVKTEQAQIVDYENYSIYGHTTEPIKAIFAVIERFWVNADLSQSDTIANVEDIEEWIAEKYPSISNTIKQAIQKITRPEQAKFLGRKS
ncbi:hypothetical protein [Bibersteinia trehalosi]|uniref:hypothetical protein n=1 Tax=Bibersteinia trehalosi TaxID=47735 RepID=UPI002D79BE95|nr:hypothetical protein [Bibersteinia trehalosi]